MENGYKIPFDTSIDTKNLEKGLSGALSKAESDVIRSAANITAKVEEEARKQIEDIRKNEKEKIDEYNKTAKEQIAIVKSTEGLGKEERQAQIQDIIKTRDSSIQAKKEEAIQHEKIVKNTQNLVTKTIQDQAKKQLKAIQDGYKKSGQAVKDFAKGAIGQLTGYDQILAHMTGGPVAMGKLVVDMAKKAIAALNEMADAWRKQEQAEVALQNAAKLNPYLTERNATLLTKFADEMQRLTGIDNVQVLQAETRLASMNRTQDQIQKIMKTAADMAAVGMMDFDSAVDSLNATLSGTVRVTPALNKELKGLSQEALASGEAIDMIAKKVSGQAAEAMKTGAGSVKAYENAVANLKKSIGEIWEMIVRPFRRFGTWVVEGLNDAINMTKELWTKINTGMWKSELELKRSRDFVDAIDKEIDAIIRRNIATEEYKNLIDLYRDAFNAGDEDAKKSYSEQLNALDELTNAEIKAIKLKKESSAEYMHLLDEELEMLRILYTINYEGGVEGVDYSKIEGERAQKYLDQHRNTIRKKSDINDRYNEIYLKKEQALAAQKELIDKDAEEKRKDRQQEQIEENQKALDAEIAKIIRQAEIKNEITAEEAIRLRKNINDEEVLNKHLELRKQIIDANVNAYENLLNIAKDTLSEEEKSANVENLRKQWEEYSRLAELEKRTDEDRKKALQELAKMQEEIQSDVTRIKNLADEAALQEQLTELRKKSITDAVEYEQNYRKQQREVEYNNEKQKLIDNFDLAIQSTQLTEDEKERLLKEYLENKKQLEKNFAKENLIIEKENVKAIEQAHVEMYQRLLSAAQEYLNAASSIASSISTIWTNNIDYETNEKLRANDKLVQSDEERAEAEKKIQIEAANERYKAELFAWSANVVMAQANMAKAVLDAYVAGMSTVNPMSPAIAAANMTLATLIGGMQVAAIMSSRPKPPRFHTGGVVEGRGEQKAVLMGGEVVQTQRQFQNTMQAISNLAGNRTANGGVQMNVKVENNASNKVKAEPEMTADGLKLVITEIVNEGFGNGAFDMGIAQQQTNQQGARIL